MTVRIVEQQRSGSQGVRRLVPGDVPAMVSIIERARREYGVQQRIQSVLEPSDIDLFATYQAPRSAYFVATNAGVVVGGAGIAPLQGDGEEVCELQRMYLSGDHRRQGIGQLLLDQCMREAAALRFRQCYAETIVEMKEAIRFYEKNGFRRLSAPIGNSGHGHNDCWLMLDLTQ